MYTSSLAEPISRVKDYIGGWSPVFFTYYDNQKVNHIIDMIKQQQVSKIKIIYPSKRQKLALRIKQAIVSATSMKPNMEVVDLQDTPTTKYNHDQVVATLYYGISKK